MSPFGARLTAASDLFRRMVVNLDIDGELSTEDLDKLDNCLKTVQDSIETYKAQIEEACNVACDKGAARREC